MYICSSLIHQHLIHQHSCVFESNITKNYYFWPPISILLILFPKNICISDLLRILVWDMVTMPGSFILLWRKFNKSGNFSVSQGKFHSFKWVRRRSLSSLTFSSINIVLIRHVICHVTILLKILNYWPIDGRFKKIDRAITFF